MLVDILGTTLVDFPGKVASTLFFAGCNLRCPFCHNAELVIPELYQNRAPISLHDLADFLTRRRDFISGVVFTGGEPLLAKDLPSVLSIVKELGLAAKLDTNGSLPTRLSDVVDDFDYIAMDFKAPLGRYSLATGVQLNQAAITQSIEIIMTRARDYEFRATLVPTLFDTEEDIIAMGEAISGAKRAALQSFSSQKTLDPEFMHLTIPSPDRVLSFARVLEPLVGSVVIR